MRKTIGFFLWLSLSLVALPGYCLNNESPANELFSAAQTYYDEQNYEDAFVHYQWAAAKGHEAAMERLISLTQEMRGSDDKEINPLLLNFLYAFFGGSLTLFFMWFGCRLLNHSVCFSINEELSRGNIAVGLMVMGIFIGIGTALGLVIGLGLN